MRTYEFRTLTPEDISAMERLLMARQNREAETFPYQKNSCLHEERIGERLRHFLTKDKAIGMGAFVNGELAGYILGLIRIDTRSGRCVITPYEGVAIRGGQPAELIRHLYAEAAPFWLEHGCYSHSAYVPLANSIYYDAFLGLSFGIEQVHAVLEIGEYKPFEGLADVKIRLAGAQDQDTMGRLSSVISNYQNQAPDIGEGFRELLGDEGSLVLLTEAKGEALGFQVYRSIGPALMVPDSAVELCVAGTLRRFMGRGVGKGLMNAGISLMKDKGYRYITTDWRITNLASSTFWPKCGFRPMAYRMHRFIVPNYAWANVNNPMNQEVQP